MQNNIILNLLNILLKGNMSTQTVCSSGLYTGWKDMFYCISPYSWAYMGVVLALGLSIIGAAW
jgi:hypothetical protein